MSFGLIMLTIGLEATVSTRYYLIEVIENKQAELNRCERQLRTQSRSLIMRTNLMALEI